MSASFFPACPVPHILFPILICISYLCFLYRWVYYWWVWVAAHTEIGLTGSWTSVLGWTADARGGRDLLNNNGVWCEAPRGWTQDLTPYLTASVMLAPCSTLANLIMGLAPHHHPERCIILAALHWTAITGFIFYFPAPGFDLNWHSLTFRRSWCWAYHSVIFPGRRIRKEKHMMGVRYEPEHLSLSPLYLSCSQWVSHRARHLTRSISPNLRSSTISGY